MATRVWKADEAAKGARDAKPIPFWVVRQESEVLLGMYAPKGVDTQQSHSQDEVYMVVRGSGEFVNGARRETFDAGDAIFVPAGVDHRFESFSGDFATWVVFWGPLGGEASPPWPANADPDEPWIWSPATTQSHEPVFRHGSLAVRRAAGDIRFASDKTTVGVMLNGSATMNNGVRVVTSDMMLLNPGGNSRATGDPDTSAWIIEFDAGD